jgi:hypothetical protein
MTQTTRADAVNDVLDREFDLTPRAAPGQRSYYRFEQTVHQLGDFFEISARTLTVSEFERTVVEKRPDGGLVEDIIWKRFTSVSGEGRTGTWGPPQEVEWAAGLSYRFCAEDSHEALQELDAQLPDGMEAEGVKMQRINTHYEFDFLRSRAHGYIDRLRKVGDDVVVPDSDRPFELRPRVLPVVWTCTKRDHTLSFAGLSRVGDRAAGVLRFWTWLDVDCRPTLADANQGKGNTQFNGTLFVDLDDGSLLDGSFEEWAAMPIELPGTSQMMRIYNQFRVTRLSEASYEQPGPYVPR